MTNLFLLEAGSSNLLYTFAPMLIILVLFYFMLIRPQSKKEKNLKNMRESVQVGDEITSIGGIVGRILSVKDDTVLIETGSDRTKLRLKKFAIQEVVPLDLGEDKKEESVKEEKTEKKGLFKKKDKSNDDLK